MSATLTSTIVDGAPGASVTLSGSGLAGGGSAKVELLDQSADGSTTTTIAAPAFAQDGSSVSFVVPDGAISGAARVTASDGSQATCALTVNSQYLFSTQYSNAGEGTDLSDFASGELDAILRRASAYADAYISQGSREAMTFRFLQTIEKHGWRKSRRVYPWRSPIVSIDSFLYISSPAIQTAFDPTQFVVSEDGRYIEMVIWSTGYTYIQALASQTLADAGIVKLTYTAGYKYANYPQALREAVTMIATELISQRRIQKQGFGGLSRVRQGVTQYDRRDEPFEIPAPAKVLLNSFRSIRPS